ncbi:hypothetical protein [Alicyclobacillus acidiphilus]|uniref:hypothetical protein n=1 Tax=Alicyclobacillus acidiphilus TaxID=182455 RepID=UPI00082B0912|nr:hypothetical protein [Alicyclobacillus acidiphilus]
MRVPHTLKTSYDEWGDGEMDVYKVFAYRTVYEVIAKTPQVFVTPPVKDQKEAETYAKSQMPDSFLIQVHPFFHN